MNVEMDVELREVPIDAASLGEHASVSIAFGVDSVLGLEAEGLAGIALRERPVQPAYTKDYDEAEHPTQWPQRFSVANWGMIAAEDDGARIGGAVIAVRTEDMYLLDGRSDLAVLWDLRVRPESRGRRVGARLFGATEAWARARGCRQLKIETQNVNVAACRFYARMGCTLGGINRYAYGEHPEETQLLWFKQL